MQINFFRFFNFLRIKQVVVVQSMGMKCWPKNTNSVGMCAGLVHVAARLSSQELPNFPLLWGSTPLSTFLPLTDSPGGGTFQLHHLIPRATRSGSEFLSDKGAIRPLCHNPFPLPDYPDSSRVDIKENGRASPFIFWSNISTSYFLNWNFMFT